MCCCENGKKKNESHIRTTSVLLSAGGTGTLAPQIIDFNKATQETISSIYYEP